MAGFGSYQNPEIIQQQTLVTSIPVGQWSGSDGNYYITVTASGITADSIIVPNYDKDSATALQGPIWCVPGVGSFTINTTKLPTDTVNIMTQFAGTMGVANYQVLADVYSRSQIDNKIANDLGTTVEGKILDARQGKILNDNKANVSDVYSKDQAVAKADIVNNLTSTLNTAPLSANMGKTLNDDLTNVDHKNVFTYVVAFNKTQTSAGNWTDGGITFPVSPGDRVTMDVMATGTGQMTRSAVGSSGHVYYSDGPNISDYEHGGRFMAFTVLSGDSSITCSSYANSAITVRTAVITVTSKY